MALGGKGVLALKQRFSVELLNEQIRRDELASAKKGSWAVNRSCSSDEGVADQDGPEGEDTIRALDVGVSLKGKPEDLILSKCLESYTKPRL